MVQVFDWDEGELGFGVGDLGIFAEFDGNGTFRVLVLRLFRLLEGCLDLQVSSLVQFALHLVSEYIVWHRTPLYEFPVLVHSVLGLFVFSTDVQCSIIHLDGNLRWVKVGHVKVQVEFGAAGGGHNSPFATSIALSHFGPHNRTREHQDVIIVKVHKSAKSWKSQHGESL